MTTFVFNDHTEFGLFLKINSEEAKEVSPSQEGKDKVDELLRVINSAKGGCPCNIKKRIAMAQTVYMEFVPYFLTDNQAALSWIAGKLDVSAINFKSDKEDAAPFFFVN
jgi:hypothetical protein